MLIRSPRMRPHLVRRAGQQVLAVEQDRPASIRPGLATSRRMDSAVTLFPQPGLADQAQDLAAIDVEVHSGHRPDDTIPCVERRLEATHVEQAVSGPANLARDL